MVPSPTWAPGPAANATPVPTAHVPPISQPHPRQVLPQGLLSLSTPKLQVEALPSPPEHPFLPFLQSLTLLLTEASCHRDPRGRGQRTINVSVWRHEVQGEDNSGPRAERVTEASLGGIPVREDLQMQSPARGNHAELTRQGAPADQGRILCFICIKS